MNVHGHLTMLSPLIMQEKRVYMLTPVDMKVSVTLSMQTTTKYNVLVMMHNRTST